MLKLFDFEVRLVTAGVFGDLQEDIGVVAASEGEAREIAEEIAEERCERNGFDDWDLTLIKVWAVSNEEFEARLNMPCMVI